MGNLTRFILINLCIIALLSFPSGAEDILSQPMGEEASVKVGPKGQLASPGSIILRVEWNNPFNPEASASPDRYTEIYYEVKEEGATIRIYTINGELVKTLVEDSSKNKDWIRWYGKNDKGEVVGSGVYLVNLKIGKSSKTVKVVVLK